MDLYVAKFTQWHFQHPISLDILKKTREKLRNPYIRMKVRLIDLEIQCLKNTKSGKTLGGHCYHTKSAQVQKELLV